MSSRTPRIAVLKGGWSAEREVSLVSGRQCALALAEAGYDVEEIDAGRDLGAVLGARRPDIVFNALHGRWGEDGCVQGLLEVLGLPYTHSGPLASALAMDKRRAKRIFADAGIPVARDLLCDRETVVSSHPLPPPYVVKPNNEGSSVGIHFVQEGDGPAQPDPGEPESLLVEAYAPGRELTVSVLGDRALCVTEIIPESGWYDYHAKYDSGGSRHVLPAAIPAGVAEACRAHALCAHRALGCRGLTRSDFRWDETRGADGLVMLEVNTQPGMTPTSLSPEQAAQDGMTFPALCRWIAEDASCGR